ncbi:hypothetical protein KUV64_13955 [Mameliella alba]|uniref:hypothetical protein n=2 Tax=Mameliella TaxID=1434019 RepID=UPI001C97B94E|nr:hypothetical protein [Mameliella alba]MBY6120237.1 hypothetical protein [Mameliella alba]MDD9733128.1 hypothetical protein [Mameliella sp. AT18]
MSQLAREAGVAASTINRPMREQDWSFALHPGTVAKIHAASGIDPAEFMPREMQEPPEMYRAATDSLAARALRDLDDPKDTSKPPPDAQSTNEIKIAVVGDMVQISATVNKDGLAELRRRLDLAEQMVG